MLLWQYTELCRQEMDRDHLKHVWCVCVTHKCVATSFSGQQAQSPLSFLQQVKLSGQATESSHGTTPTTNKYEHKNVLIFYISTHIQYLHKATVLH